MKKFIYASIVSLSLLGFSAFVLAGPIVPMKPGVTYNTYGNTTYGNDGSRYNTYGNTTYGNDGSRYNTYGNTTYGNDGSRSTTYGNTTYGNS